MGKFVMKKAKSGYMFNLKAGNGEVILTSQIYASEETCQHGIESIMKAAPEAGIEDQTVEGFETIKHPKFEVYTDKGGDTRYRLKASNGQIIGAGQGYASKAGCLKGIESIKKNSVDATIVNEIEEE